LPPDPKLRRWLWCAPIVLWCAIAGRWALRLAGWTQDDFYITYRYAWNLARGSGFVFNPGERVFGTTDPGLGLLLGALHAGTGIAVPFLGAAVFSLSLVGIAALLLIAGRRRGYVIEPVLGGTLLVASSYLWANLGAAVPLAILLLLLAAMLAARSAAAAGLLAGAAAWVRPDAGLGVALLAVILVIETRRVPWRFLLAAGCVVAAGIGLAWLYFGQPLPNTFGAKADMAAATPDSWSGLRFWLRGSVLIQRHFGRVWPAVLIGAAAGCWPLARKGGRTGLLLALFGLGIAVAYPLLGVPFFSWYVLPCLIAAIYGLAFFAGAAGRALAARAPAWPSVRVLFAAGIFALLAAGPLARSWSFFRSFHPAAYLQSYRRGAEWIRANTPPDASIAYVEIGVIGYYSERPMLDLMGLVTPAARPYVLRNDLLGALKERPTELVLLHPRGRMAMFVHAGWFRKRYREVMRFEDPEGSLRASLRIFRQRPGRQGRDRSTSFSSLRRARSEMARQ
jgi:hypothetical protein